LLRCLGDGCSGDLFAGVVGAWHAGHPFCITTLAPPPEFLAT